MRKLSLLCVFLLCGCVFISGCTSSSSNEFKVGNSTFNLSSDFEESFNSEGGELAERIRIDSVDKSIIVVQYHDKELYNGESKHAVATKTINGTECKFIPPAAVWFEKNGKLYSVAVQGLDSENNWINATSSDIKYIEEIISTLN